MRLDVLAGIGISGLLHVAVFFGGALFPSKPPVIRPPEAKPVIQLTQHKQEIEPEEPPPTEFSKDPVKPADLVPSQIDVPQPVTDISFIQRPQPPPPEGAVIPTGLMTIPDTRSGPSASNLPVFDPASLDHQPVARVRTPPTYPYDMRRNGVEGTVLVDFIVDPNGDVMSATAASSSHREFEAAAVDAVRKWKFKPGRRANRAVHTHMQVPIVFSLNQAD